MCKLRNIEEPEVKECRDWYREPLAFDPMYKLCLTVMTMEISVATRSYSFYFFLWNMDYAFVKESIKSQQRNFFGANKEIYISRIRNASFKDFSRGFKSLPNLAMPVLLTLSPNILQSPLTPILSQSPQGLLSASWVHALLTSSQCLP